VLTIAQAKPHDLYFYAQPTEMLAGDVLPPGVFLNASAVLERQLAAFSLDQWNGTPGQHRFAARLREVFAHLDPQTAEHFPHNWLAFVRREQHAAPSRLRHPLQRGGRAPRPHRGEPARTFNGFFLGDDARAREA
jgi:DEAD/DEAH box helicase domain-containing protein